MVRNLEIGNTPSEFCLISGDWGELKIPNLASMSLMNCYQILQNAKVTAFTVSELLMENQQEVKLPPSPTHMHTPRLGLKYSVPKNIPIAFHNGSNYDYHFIIKALAEEFTCLGEKYITLTVLI